MKRRFYFVKAKNKKGEIYTGIFTAKTSMDAAKIAVSFFNRNNNNQHKIIDIKFIEEIDT